MPAYLVQVKPEVSGQYLMDGQDSHIVFAADAAGARAAVQSRHGNDVDAIWADSAVVSVTEIAVGADFEDWTLRLSLYDVDAREPAISVAVVGEADDTLDDLGAAAVTALNATAIAGAAYDDTGNVLTVAETTDGLGDHTLSVEWIPPWGETSFAPLLGDIVDGGDAGDAVTLDFVADAPTIPDHVAALRRR